MPIKFASNYGYFEKELRLEKQGWKTQQP